MTTNSADAAWASARAAHPEGMSRDEISRLLAEVRRARSWLDSIEVRASRRIGELAALGQSEPAASMIANAGGHSGREARSITKREALCDEMPGVEGALAEGRITSGYVDAMSNAASGLPEAVRADYAAMASNLLARAGQLSLDAFRRECRELARHLLARDRAGSALDELAAQRDASNITRWVDRQTGMHHTHLELDPVRDAKLHSLATAELARMRASAGSKDRSWQQLQVDAFVNAGTGMRTPPPAGEAQTSQGDRRAGSDSGIRARPGPGDPTIAAAGCRGDGMCPSPTIDRVPEITALISYEWLVGQASHGICETEAGEPIPIAAMRRLCCDAEILPVVLGGSGEVLEHGRSRRTASRSQRRALRAMHRACASPDCDIGFDACRIHHIRWWWRDIGPTDIDNLLPLCEQHHHLVHEGGWTLSMTQDRIATWSRPDGSVHHRGPTIDRTPAGVVPHGPAAA